ncbi:acetyl-CoA hydrolase/transferase family protein [Lysobacter sp. A6]|uniref:Acetyl-CoA hydrolase/transferase family protein n=1 Tax=Noviluteimonas lactosilytica TaxID=2888523 RepID=A0ABS8JMG3_9GAMM|nr:acetyl-CoA hydrolase/transferase family protein [Lysobacter lactosilyticus]MCC8364665.1 acetyl-CoA hydrolase/transferase family protein [Lysobacter lactosilyticus]
MDDRIQHAGMRQRLMPADQAAAVIRHGDTVCMSGFTGAGYPKCVPQALAARIQQAHARGDPFRVRLLTGASTAPELDGALAKVEGMELRLPYQSDPTVRDRINAGQIDYLDIHLSHVAQHTWFGFFGDIDVAVVEIAAILPDGRLLPTSSIGNNRTWLERAGKVILEVNRWQPLALDGMHDVYYGTALPPDRKPIPLVRVEDRIGERYLLVDPDKVVAVVETDAHDRNSPFSPPDDCSQRIAGHLLEFIEHEVARRRLTPRLLPLQSGVGNIANAVLAGIAASGYQNLEAWTEVIQDNMLRLLRDGVLRFASATALSLSGTGTAEFFEHIDFYRRCIVLRPQEISNHPELIRRLGCIAMNGMLETDIYGNVNSTHVAGSRIMNGIGGSGDFARNAFLSIFMAPSTAKQGGVSTIVPMASHVDHTEHDTMIVVTEQGLADLRGLSPRQRARDIIAKCAHPSYRSMLEDYFDRACRNSFGKHTPHLLREALSWHARFVETGSMRIA